MRKFLAALIASLIFFASGEAYAPEGQLIITQLNVGQGESILIETSSQNILIDTGDVTEQDKLKAELDKAGVTRFEQIILTHPHADHIGGMEFLLNNYAVDEISDNGLYSTSPLYFKYRTADVKFSTLKAGDVLDFGNGVEFIVMSPTPPVTHYSNVNNSSIVGKLVYKNFSMMLTGDAEKEAELELWERNDLESTILKAGHHGAKTSSTADFIAAVSPEVILISAGEDNKFGHPNKATLSTMRMFCGKIFCTRFNGTIKVISDGETYSLDVEYPVEWLEPYTGERVTVTRL